MKEQKKKKGNRMPSIKYPEDFLNPKRELYNAIIQVFMELKNEPLKTRELRYLLLKNHGLKFHSKLSKRVIGERTLENYKFPDFDFKPQNLSNHLSTLTSERWKILRKDKEGYSLTKKGLALEKKCWLNSYLRLQIRKLEEHPIKSLRVEPPGQLLHMGFEPDKFSKEDAEELKKNIKKMCSCITKIRGILTKNNYKDSISLLANIYSEQAEPIQTLIYRE